MTHVTETNGTRVVRFADGRKEVHLPDGTKRVQLGGVESVSSPDGRTESKYPDGTRIIEESDGCATVYFKDGSKETRCKDFTVRLLLLWTAKF